MRILQINVTANCGSTGRIAEGIGISAQKSGFDSWIAYGRRANQSSLHLIRIGSKVDYLEHGIETRIFDNHGLSSRRATVAFLKKIEIVKPDLVHLHNIHGYYINIKMLFQFLREKSIPSVWTLHDCWSFTGHCVYFSFCGCTKWMTGCYDCPQKKTYPSSFIFDRSKNNYIDKHNIFTSIQNLTIVPVSNWLDKLVSFSFLKECKRTVIHNGIDTEVFSPCIDTKRIRRKLGFNDAWTILLGVASVWSERKGLRDFIKLSRHLSQNERIVLIGLSKKQIKSLPQNIIAIEHTESTKQLAEYYSAADLFLNFTYEDNYPTTNLESISCGTPCLTYHTGGSIESITPETGFVVPQGDLDATVRIITEFQKKGKKIYSSACRKYALSHFRAEDRFMDYISLYRDVLQTKSS